AGQSTAGDTAGFKPRGFRQGIERRFKQDALIHVRERQSTTDRGEVNHSTGIGNLAENPRSVSLTDVVFRSDGLLCKQEVLGERGKRATKAEFFSAIVVGG